MRGLLQEPDSGSEANLMERPPRHTTPARRGSRKALPQRVKEALFRLPDGALMVWNASGSRNLAARAAAAKQRWADDFCRRRAMTKRDLVIRISKETGIIQEDVFTVLQKSLDYIIEALKKGENVEFRNFGVFEVRTRKARIGRNPNKPENIVQIPACKVAKFKPGRQMKADIGKA
jgi:nucleoid DNA-binding protein